MTEKILTNKKHGMAMLIFFLLLMAAAIVMVVIGAMRNIIALILPGIVILCFIWIPMMGLKILKPQEALVLTLFGHYYGTLKGEGYYYVNPFCTGVNPAAKTRLSQSGDVKTLGVKATTGDNTTSIEVDTTGKKLSLKIMTLSNNRQKINDCLGNPVEIGIAVTWRIIDTAKAVFNVDNYKEYLSLQCDSALRNIVRLSLGAEGQILIGGIVTAGFMRAFGGDISTPLLLVIMAVVSLLAGAAWGMVPATFKAVWNTNETLFTLMMNYVAIQLTSYFVALWENPVGSNTVGVINQRTKYERQ